MITSPSAVSRQLHHDSKNTMQRKDRLHLDHVTPDHIQKQARTKKKIKIKYITTVNETHFKSFWNVHMFSDT